MSSSRTPRLNANILHTVHTVTHSYDILPLAQARPMMLCIYTSKGNVCHNLLQAKLTAYHLTSSFSLVPRPEEDRRRRKAWFRTFAHALNYLDVLICGRVPITPSKSHG